MRLTLRTLRQSGRTMIGKTVAFALTVSLTLPPTFGVAAELEHFLQCVRTGEQPKCTAADALPALTCVLGAKTAIETGTVYEFKPEEFRIA